MAKTLRQEIMKHYTISRFDGGLNNAFADHMLQDNQASAILNFDLTTRGSIKVRGGFTRLNVSSMRTSPIRGLARFYNTSGTNKWAAFCSGRLYYGTTSLSTYLTQTFTVDSDMEFEVFKDTLLMVNGVEKYKSRLFSASDASSWTGAPIMNTLRVWQDRVWGVPTNSAYVLRHTSAAGVIDGWRASDYIAVGRQDGGSILAIEVFRGVMVILKTTGIYILTGTHPDNYQLERMSKHGCISRRSVVVGDTGIIYLAPDGVRIFDGMTSTPLSETEQYKVKIVDAINMNAVNDVAATYFDRKYILCYDDVGATEIRNNYAFVFNFLTGTWTKYYLPANVFFKTLGSNEDLGLYFGSSVSGFIYKMFNGTTDDNPAAIAADRVASARAISAHYKTKGFDFSSQYKDLGAMLKQFREVITHASVADSHITIAAEIDRGAGITETWQVHSEAVATFVLGVGVLGVNRLGAGITTLDNKQSLPVKAQGKTISIRIDSNKKSQETEINLISFGFREKRVGG